MLFIVTINNALNQALKRIGKNLTEPVFTHGQLYVELSKKHPPEDAKTRITDEPSQEKIFKTESSFTKTSCSKKFFNFCCCIIGNLIRIILFTQ